MGGRGPVGLDYNPIQHELARRKVTDREYTEMMDALRVIESAAIDELMKE